jgi:uncharacterized protein YdaU (DUF1376 family)
MAGHGCYLLLLTYCWDSKGPLPLDEERIAGICEARSQEERNTMGRILATYFTRMDDGWYNRRMQLEIERCHVIGLARKAAGAKGYQARAKQMPSKSQASAKQEHLTIPNLILSPASSPSPEGKSKSIARKRATPMPAGFTVSDAVRTWAAGKGFDRLDVHLEVFRDKAEAKGYVYADWDKALQNAIREDWAGIRKPALQGKTKTETPTERRRANLNVLCGRNPDGSLRNDPASLDGAIIPPSDDDLRGTQDGVILRRLPAG